MKFNTDNDMDMIKFICFVIAFDLSLLIMKIFNSCSSRETFEKTSYVTVVDTFYVDTISTKLVEVNGAKDSLNDIIKSINITKDSIDEELIVAKYKLNRIKYYNDVAAKGNNIKYLRGWINRVLNE